jgi:hypothetical protein
MKGILRIELVNFPFLNVCMKFIIIMQFSIKRLNFFYNSRLQHTRSFVVICFDSYQVPVQSK